MAGKMIFHVRKYGFNNYKEHSSANCYYYWKDPFVRKMLFNRRPIGERVSVLVYRFVAQPFHFSTEISWRLTAAQVISRVQSNNVVNTVSSKTACYSVPVQVIATSNSPVCNAKSISQCRRLNARPLPICIAATPSLPSGPLLAFIRRWLWESRAQGDQWGEGVGRWRLWLMESGSFSWSAWDRLPVAWSEA